MHGGISLLFAFRLSLWVEKYHRRLVLILVGSGQVLELLLLLFELLLFLNENLNVCLLKHSGVVL